MGTVAQIDETLLAKIAFASASVHDLCDRGDVEGDVSMSDGDVRVSVDSNSYVNVLVREVGEGVPDACAGGNGVATGKV